MTRPAGTFGASSLNRSPRQQSRSPPPPRPKPCFRSGSSALPGLPRPQTLRPARLARLAALCATFRPEADININIGYGDVRVVLGSATSFAISTAATTGPDRVPHVTELLLADLRAQPSGFFCAGPAQRLLLNITSPAVRSLQMDELTAVLETIQRALGQELEIVFGHHETAEAVELRVWLLLGCGASA